MTGPAATRRGPGRPIIMLVTDRRLYAGRLLAALHAAARAGVDLIQIREPGFPDRALLDLARSAVAAAEGTSARVVVNERVDVAIAAGAAGVHLRGASFRASRVRAIVPRSFIVGRSVHDEAEARDAAAEGGCDYLTFGTVFHSASKPSGHRPAGADALRRACAAVPLPVLAIGGVTGATAREAFAAGAAGVAAIGLFAASADLPETVASLRRAFDSASGLA